MLFQLIIIQIVTFFAIVFVLRKILYTETANQAKRLKELKEENYRKEKELARKMESADGAYREKLLQAGKEGRRIQKKAEEDAEQLRKKITENAKEEAERIIKEAINTKDKMRDEVANAMREKAPRLAAQIFKDALSPKIKETTHRELVGEVLAEAKKIDKGKFSGKAKSGEIISALPLSRNEKNALVSVITQKAGHKISFAEKEDKALVAGVIIKLGTVIIDGSLENRLRHIAHA